MRVIHIITSLEDGGAEALLYRMCLAMTSHCHIVISLKNGGKYGPLLEDAGIKVYQLNMLGLVSFLPSFLRLYNILKLEEPDIVQTWLYHADLFGGLCAKLARVKKIFWGIHNTSLKFGRSSLSSQIAVRLLALFSYWIPQKIICCSKASLDIHEKMGYRSSKLVLIHNGYDTTIFRPKKNSRTKIRCQLKIKHNELLLGMVARFHPQKDHKTFLEALQILKENKGLKFRCLFVGAGIEKLKNEVLLAGLEEFVILHSATNDISSVYNALDILILSSAFGEACPNVIAEGMSCGIPCVATDIGDTKFIIGKTGIVVPPKEPTLLADAIEELAELRPSDQWVKTKLAARERIIDHFSLAQMLDNYQRTWLSVVVS